MPDRRITAHTELAEQPHANDLIEIIDVSDTTDAATGTNKKIKRANLLGTVLAATTASFTTADETKLDGIETGATADQSAAEILAALLTVDGAGSGLDADLLDGTSSAGFVLKSLFDAHTILAATSDDTPVALTVAEQTLVGRITGGNIAALSDSQVRTLLGLVIGTNVQAYDADLTTLASAFASASASGPATLALAEDTDNGTNKATLSAPASLASDVTVTLPSTTGTLLVDSLADAKGDLFVASAADTVTRLAVGTNNHVLTADSTQATGVKWAAASGGGTFPDAVNPTTRWGLPNVVVHDYQTNSAADKDYDTVECAFFLPNAITVTDIGAYCSTGGTGGCVTRYGIYSCDETLWAGTLTLVSDLGTVAADSSGDKTITGLSVACAAGWYVIVSNHNGASAPQYNKFGTSPGGTIWLSVGNTIHIAKKSRAYGAMGASITSSGWEFGYNGWTPGLRGSVLLKWT